MDINKILKRAGDFHSMMSADDKLDAIIRDTLNDELSEDELDYVAAARSNSHPFDMNDDWGKND